MTLSQCSPPCWGNSPRRGQGACLCLEIQANDEAVSDPVGVGRGERCGFQGKKQPSKPPWLAALEFSGSLPVGTVTAAGQPPLSPKQGHCLSSMGTLLEDSG